MRGARPVWGAVWCLVLAGPVWAAPGPVDGDTGSEGPADVRVEDTDTGSTPDPMDTDTEGTDSDGEDTDAEDTDISVAPSPDPEGPEAVSVGAPSAAPAEGPVAPPEAPEARRALDVVAKATGHVKAFATASFPYESPILPDAPQGQGFLDQRLTLSLAVDEVFEAEVAHALTATIGAAQATGSVLGTGVGATAPQALPLTWTAFDDPDSTLRLQGRVDRLVLRGHAPQVDLALGRQPISFGNGRFFTPMDLVQPFTPAVIDTEFKPGVDAFRIDVYPSFSSAITGVVAYTGNEGWKGDWTAEEITGAVYGQGTVGVTDLGGMYAWVEGDHVVAATLASAIGPAGVIGDVAVTVPRDDLDEPVFVRATLGMDGRPTGTTTVSAEVYVQSLGSTDPADLLDTLGSERAMRGEIWLAGIAYLGTSLTQEITPLVTFSLSTITNLTQPSTLILPGISWSIAGNADLAAGAYLPVGERPETRTPTLEDPLPVAIRSEFGTYPFSAYLQVRAYF